jgi:hypothetical protein
VPPSGRALKVTAPGHLVGRRDAGWRLDLFDQILPKSEELANQRSTLMSMTFGLIVGNRGFFPDHLARSGANR